MFVGASTVNIQFKFLTGVLEGKLFPISGDLVIGRSESIALCVPDPSVSSRHCRIRFHGDRVLVEDLESTNGTELNGAPIQTAELHDGDQIALGETKILVQLVKEHEDHPEPTLPEPPAPSEATRGRRHATQILAKKPGMKKRFLLPVWSAIIVAWILGCGIAMFRGCRSELGPGVFSANSMVSAKAKEEARQQMRSEGVKLTIREPVGLVRKGEPVTSGVPLPEGCVKEPTQLCLFNQAKKPMPCQFTPLCRWPDGSIKWGLLDFQADLAPSNTMDIVLTLGDGNASPEEPVKVEKVAEGVSLSTGPMVVTIATNQPGIIQSLKFAGKEIVGMTNPAQVVLVCQDGKTYRGSRPSKVAAEYEGPLRGTVLVQGEFMADDGSRIFDGKVGYDLRLTAYAGKPWLKVDFTLKNDGWYGYRNEGGSHPRQWLYIRSLRLDIPLPTAPGEECAVDLCGSCRAQSNDNVCVIQWYKYATQDSFQRQEYGATDEMERSNRAGMTNETRGFYYTFAGSNGCGGHSGKLPGFVEVHSGGNRLVSLAAHRFHQNFPRGFEAARNRISLLVLPEGGFWPRCQKAHDSGTYQFEGGRHKTVRMLFSLGRDEGGEKLVRRFDFPLFARAPVAWYRDTGAVVPLASPALKAGDKELAEAMKRYDRLQRAKVTQDAGDSAGSIATLIYLDEWGRVSIPSLWDRSAELFEGWMNYGDLTWEHGYCSLYYDWPYTMLLQYLRLGEHEFYDVAADMMQHRNDIDQYHVGNTAPYLGGFQRYEKGEHGNLERQKPFNMSWEKNANPSHTWNRGPLLHWALTGDPRSLETALQNGRAYYRFFYGQHGLKDKEKLPWGEFRVPVWAMENWMALYEFLGDRQYLEWANEVFNKSLLAMEKDNGCRGHIIKNGAQSAQFTGYTVEPVCRLHHLTGREDVIQFLRRVLDWQRKEGSRRGVTRWGRYYPTIWLEDWEYDPGLRERCVLGASHSYSLPMLDGYAYLYHVLGRSEDRDFSRKLFKEIMFYYGLGNSAPKDARTPLGYHYRGCPLDTASKLHAWTGRYGQIFLSVEEENPDSPPGSLR